MMPLTVAASSAAVRASSGSQMTFPSVDVAPAPVVDIRTTVHNVKVEERWYGRIERNEKHAEIRLDDRDYQTGDILRLRILNGNEYRYIERTITHVLRSASGLADGYVVLSLDDPRVAHLTESRDRAWKDVETLTHRINGLRGHITRLKNGGAR